MKRKDQYSSPFVRMWTSNYRRCRGLGEPPVLPMAYEEEESDSQRDFYAEESLLGNAMSRVAGVLLGLAFILIGAAAVINPGTTQGRFGELSATENVCAGVFGVFLGIALLVFCYFRHGRRGRPSRQN